MDVDRFYVMSPWEIACGFPMGSVGVLAPDHGPRRPPRHVLEEVIRRALERPPCGVAFSGGRDSSVVLAVATHVARRDGLPDPIPITREFPDIEESDEFGWQELVIRHLGLGEWHRSSFTDELDVLGPLATEFVREHGVVWPPTIAADIPLNEPVRGGSLLDGQGGDEVLGVESHRIAPMSRLVRHPRPLRPRRIRSALTALAPAPVRVAEMKRHWRQEQFTWLRPAAREKMSAAIIDEVGSRPLSFAASVRQMPVHRTEVLLARNRRILAKRWDVVPMSPLLEPDFVHAIARDGGVRGRGDRTDVLRRLVSDLLPDAILARTSKAIFTFAYIGATSRHFASQWTGEGVDHDLVDAEELRRLWTGGARVASTAGLLQSAWRASMGDEG